MSDQLGTILAKELQSPELVSITLELELNSVLVNRVTKPLKQAQTIVEAFQDLHGPSGRVYVIRESKMNFSSLLNEIR